MKKFERGNVQSEKKNYSFFDMANTGLLIYFSYLHSNEIILKLLLPENLLDIAFVKAILPWSSIIISLTYLILWKHSNSCGPMFVDCQVFAALWGRNFNWFVALQCKTIFYSFNSLWGHKFVGNPRNPQTLIPHKQWWFHSI